MAVPNPSTLFYFNKKNKSLLHNFFKLKVIFVLDGIDSMPSALYSFFSISFTSIKFYMEICLKRYKNPAPSKLWY